MGREVGLMVAYRVGLFVLFERSCFGSTLWLTGMGMDSFGIDVLD